MAVELRGSVLLRELRPSDRLGFVALAHDEAMFEYMKFRLDETNAADYFDFLVGVRQWSPRRTWNLVVETPDGEFAGWAGLDARSDDGEAEFGWYLASRHWGRGYATEATRLLIDFACGTLDLCRLFATADPENAASRRVLEKSGLSYGGLVEEVQTWRGSRPRVRYELLCARISG